MVAKLKGLGALFARSVRVEAEGHYQARQRVLEGEGCNTTTSVHEQMSVVCLTLSGVGIKPSSYRVRLLAEGLNVKVVKHRTLCARKDAKPAFIQRCRVAMPAQL